ncbi:MAG: hypothetical protein R6X02_11100 [Enhygromyxa sp.]
MLWVAEARAPQVFPLSFPRPDAVSFDVLEGVDVVIDGVAVSRDRMG